MRIEEGPHAELVDKLTRLAEGWGHLEDARREHEALTALEDITERGELTTWAGHTFYVVQSVDRTPG